MYTLGILLYELMTQQPWTEATLTLSPLVQSKKRPVAFSANDNDHDCMVIANIIGPPQP